MALISMRKVGSYYKQGYGPRKNAIEDYRSYGNQVGWEKEVLEDLLDSIQNGKEGVDFVFAKKDAKRDFNNKTQEFMGDIVKRYPGINAKKFMIKDIEKMLLKKTLVKGVERKQLPAYFSHAQRVGGYDCIVLVDAYVKWRYLKVAIEKDRPCWIIVFHPNEQGVKHEEQQR